MIAESGNRIEEILQQYGIGKHWQAVREESGMNNTTRMVYAGVDKYVLRIYDNHRDSDIVKIEHVILQELQGAGLPYLIPQPVPNLSNETVTRAADGKLGALYHYIEGERPTANNCRHVEGLGRASGLLVKALKHTVIPVQPLIEPYYECEQTHAAMTDVIMEDLACQSPELEGRLRQLDFLADQRQRLKERNPSFAVLPQQWIHGDIGFTNALAQGDRISGLLDFEFCTRDAAVMELAVVLADFPGVTEETSLNQIMLFCRGFGTAMKFSEEELELLPELIKLRMMDVFLHFAGRYTQGLDPYPVWEQQITRAAFVCQWIDRCEDKLGRLLRQYLFE
ncbi:phosphotransferase [Paenibacillus nasutitermitis]|uniref:Homoserine kinase n=1 Tax=Paenibacillus nasutitermitis TaxID=1652958 RepID=A0A916YW35_9BACL|nr:phosphotransferase [Paenibacillus nasutitermitis]GGD63578.1 homoserine kinase [Paenibacillus nasutitermitis]